MSEGNGGREERKREKQRGEEKERLCEGEYTRYKYGRKRQTRKKISTKQKVTDRKKKEKRQTRKKALCQTREIDKREGEKEIDKREIELDPRGNIQINKQKRKSD